MEFFNHTHCKYAGIEAFNHPLINRFNNKLVDCFSTLLIILDFPICCGLIQLLDKFRKKVYN